MTKGISPKSNPVIASLSAQDYVAIESKYMKKIQEEELQITDDIVSEIIKSEEY